MSAADGLMPALPTPAWPYNIGTPRYTAEQTQAYAREYAASLAVPAVPPGYKLVPIVPTPEMLDASYYPDVNAARRAEIYTAMLSAAPLASPTPKVPA